MSKSKLTTQEQKLVEVFLEEHRNKGQEQKETGGFRMLFFSFLILCSGLMIYDALVSESEQGSLGSYVNAFMGTTYEFLGTLITNFLKD